MLCDKKVWRWRVLGSGGVVRDGGRRNVKEPWRTKSWAGLLFPLSLWFPVGGTDAPHLSVGGPWMQENTSSGPG